MFQEAILNYTNKNKVFNSHLNVSSRSAHFMRNLMLLPQIFRNELNKDFFTLMFRFYSGLFLDLE